MHFSFFTFILFCGRKRFSRKNDNHTKIKVGIRTVGLNFLQITRFWWVLEPNYPKHFPSKLLKITYLYTMFFEITIFSISFGINICNRICYFIEFKECAKQFSQITQKGYFILIKKHWLRTRSSVYHFNTQHIIKFGMETFDKITVCTEVNRDIWKL